MLCDRCERACHASCCGLAALPASAWNCGGCAAKRAGVPGGRLARAAGAAAAAAVQVLDSDDDDDILGAVAPVAKASAWAPGVFL